MTTRWIDPTLSLMEQQELDLAWNDYWTEIFITMNADTDDEEEVDEEEEWEEGPQTPPLGPHPPRWRRLVAIGGGLAVSVDDTDSEEDDENWTLSSASSVSTEYRE